jgi:hypothetical protein
LIGHTEGSEDIVLRKFRFKLNDSETCNLVSENSPHEYAGSHYQLRIYPMPVIESAIVEWPFDLQGQAAIDIFTSQGERAGSYNVKSSDGHQKQIDTGGLSPGIYFIRLSNAELQLVTKLVKM